jgi:hypothetical protein
MAKIQARALSQFYDGGKSINPNDLVEGDTALIKALEKAGVVDSHKESVAYCKQSGATAIAIKGDGFNLAAATAADDLAAEAEVDQVAATAEAALSAE